MTDPSHTVLKFWFEEIEPAAWWKADPAFDERVRVLFCDLLRQAAQGEHHTWRHDAKGRLAEIIILDQFSRNIFRNTPRAFAQDPMALALAQEAVAANSHKDLSATERGFLFLPYTHSESRLIQALGETLYREYGLPENYAFALRHKAIVDRFGRFPHRNAVLRRESTPEELAFLAQPGSSF